MTEKNNIVFSEIIRDIDNDLNIIDISTLTQSSKVPLWWRCDNNHTYKTSVYSRVRSRGCKECNKKSNWDEIIKNNQQSGKFTRFVDKASQEIIDLWEKSLNDKHIDDVSAGSKTKYKWRCTNDHVWEASPKSLIRGTRCPICHRESISIRNRKISLRKSGNLYDARPDLREQWDPLNTISMEDVSPGSNTRIKWICKYGHKWEATISNRVGRGSGCPFCTNQTSKLEIYLLVQLRSVFDNVLWREKIDGKEVDILLKDQHIGIEVDGEYWHRNKFDADLAKEKYLNNTYDLTVIRVRPLELPNIGPHNVSYTRNDKQQKVCIELFKYLNRLFPANKNLLEYIELGVSNNYDDYLEMIARLPAPVEGTSLADLYPKLVNEWDYVRNKPLTPDLFSSSSNQNIFWVCNQGHSFSATIKNRTNHCSGCPICNDALRSDRANLLAINKLGSISENFPMLIGYWDSQANDSLDPNQVSCSLNKMFAWRCVKGHKFMRMLRTMTKGTHCLVCL
jgi:hypothetical protein